MIARKQYRLLQMQKHSITLQTALRGFLARKMLSKLRSSTLKIQVTSLRVFKCVNSN